MENPEGGFCAPRCNMAGLNGITRCRTTHIAIQTDEFDSVRVCDVKLSIRVTNAGADTASESGDARTSWDRALCNRSAALSGTPARTPYSSEAHRLLWKGFAGVRSRLASGPRERPVTVSDNVIDDSELNRAHSAFLQAVLICHAVHEAPTEADLERATAVMIAYAQQVQDNPPEATPSLIVKRWLSPLSNLDRIKVAAAAFVMFGATKPNIFQVRAAHRQIFGADAPIQLK